MKYEDLKNSWVYVNKAFLTKTNGGTNPKVPFSLILMFILIEWIIINGYESENINEYHYLNEYIQIEINTNIKKWSEMIFLQDIIMYSSAVADYP